jgi:hypothetical protein
MHGASRSTNTRLRPSHTGCGGQAARDHLTRYPAAEPRWPAPAPDPSRKRIAEPLRQRGRDGRAPQAHTQRHANRNADSHPKGLWTPADEVPTIRPNRS